VELILMKIAHNLQADENTLCYHCCHSLVKNQVFNLPTAYDTYTKEYKVAGMFCSWECVKAFNLYDCNLNNKNYRFSLINMLYWDMTKKEPNIITAPPRTLLQVFGGNLKIEDFRKNENAYKIYEPPLVNANPNIEISSNFSWVNSNQAKNNYSKVPSKNVEAESMRLPGTVGSTEQQTSLEKSMGIFKS
jgi:hypothetical protein